MFARHLVAVALVGSISIVAFAAEPRIEVTPTGQKVIVEASATDGTVVTRGGGVPYGTSPDWQNTLRRQVSGLVIADVNGDNWNDLIVGCYQSQSYPPYPDWENLIYFNVGGELEAEPSWISSDEVHTNDVAVGDLNGDGFPDIFSANGGSAFSPSRIYWGSATGPSTTPGWTATLPMASWATAVALFDVDNDEDLDVMTTNQGVSPLPFRPMYMFYNNGSGPASSPGWQSAEESIQSAVAAGDYNNDGWIDIAVSKWSNGFESGIYHNAGGSLQTTPIWTTGVSDTDKGVAWADVDGNEWLDLALGHDPTRLYSNTGGALSLTWSAVGTHFGHQDLKFCDVDRDGWPDLAEIHFSNGKVQIYRNNAGVLDASPTWVYDSPAAGTAIAFGDINGDGWHDLAAGFSGQPCISIFYAQPPALEVGDLNCDGRINVFDIDPFVLALTDETGYAAEYPYCDWHLADINGDGSVNVFDIDPFVAVLTGG
ncbi:MAG: hypothetical protein GX547_12550 [Phycisphaerae bacterium]|nr:hypothetical protein [Phycisphaerae bacterium]